MLHVKHLVIEHVLHNEFGHSFAIEAAIEDDLIDSGIEAAELRAPSAGTPAEARAMETSTKILAIQRREHWREIVDRALRTDFYFAAATTARAQDAAPGALRYGVPAIGIDEFARSAAAIQARKKNRGGGFDDFERCAAENIGDTDVRNIFAKTNCVDQICVGMKFHDEVRRASIAAEAGVDALKHSSAAGDLSAIRCWKFHD